MDARSEESGFRSPDVLLEERENNQQLEIIVRALPDKYRAVIKMRNEDGMSYHEIAEIMGVTQANVSRVKRRVEKMLCCD